MARDARAPATRGKSKPKKDWTYKLDGYKVYIYLAQILVFILLIVRGIIDDMDDIQDGYFDLPGIFVPIAILVCLLGIEEAAISTLVGHFRSDLSDRYRFLEAAKRGAISTVIVSFVIAGIMLAPPIHDMMEDAFAEDVSRTRYDLAYDFRGKDALNLTGLTKVTMTTEDGVEIDIRLLRGDSIREGEEEVNVSGVREWELTFDQEDTGEFWIEGKQTNGTGEVTWRLTEERKVRASFIQGVAFPFFLLGVVNAVVYPVLRLWSSKTETTYVSTQTRKLRARFKIEEAFLIYEDGRLIAHNSRRLKPERDKDILTGMLTAVQSFVTDTLIDEERGTLDQLKYGNLSILVEGKSHVNLATIISGEESPVLRQGMKNIVSYISSQYHRYLEDWDGDVDRFKDVKRYIGHLVSTGQEEAVWPDEVFLFHRDGRLVAHQTSRLEPSIDDGMLQSWVDQIVSAVRKAMADPGKPMPAKLNMMGYDVFLEYTNYLSMALMTTRKDEERRREVMSDVLQDVDAKFHGILYEWDGATHELTDVKVMMEVVLE
jgi:hypothetical protein